MAKPDKPETVDRDARSKAASLLVQMRDGQISLRMLMKQWPKSSKDRALLRVQAHLIARHARLPLSPLERKHRMEEAAPAVGQDKALLDHAAGFLQSDLPYLWPDPWAPWLMLLGFLAALILLVLGILKGIGAMPHRGIMGLLHWVSGTIFAGGLLLMGSWRLGNAITDRRLKAFGQESYWPFASERERQANRAPATEETNG